MKTAKQWFLDTLPKDIAEKAIKNITYEYHRYESFKNAIQCSFIWMNTEEGLGYWINVKNKYK